VLTKGTGESHSVYKFSHDLASSLDLSNPQIDRCLCDNTSVEPLLARPAATRRGVLSICIIGAFITVRELAVVSRRT
jgi:hypothetical protein